VNRNKLSVTVNIKDSQGQEIIRRLASQCDVLIENYLPGKLSSYGLGYEQLNPVNPRLIYASVFAQWARRDSLSHTTRD
jgi:succinate--hydroxymethylglutarate CoA-transferase